MSAAAKLASAQTQTQTDALPWAEICQRHPSEWVCLVDVHHSHDGSIDTGRVVGHDRSAKVALARSEWPADEPVVIAHTAGRKLHTPRIAIADEDRDLLRARR